MNSIVARLTEPSTHAGFAGLCQAAKVFFPQYAAVIDGATMFFGALAVAMKEKGHA